MTLIKPSSGEVDPSTEITDKTLEECSTAIHIYTIAQKSKECYGHGSYGEELKIAKEGGYGAGEFPPCFYTQEEAKEYLDAKEFSSGEEVVALRLSGQPPCHN